MARRALDVAAVGLQLPGVEVVVEVVLQHIAVDLARQLRVQDRETGLDPAQQVAFQPVRAGAEQLRGAVIAEPVDPAVLQETADDRAHPDVVRDAGHPGAQGAGAAHDQVDLHAGLRSGIQRADHLRFVEGVHLGDDPPGAPAGRQPRFALDPLQQARVQGEGRLQQALELHPRGQPGQLLEQQVHIVADIRIGGDQAQVGIRACGAAVIVAGTQVDIAAQLAAFAAHDQQHLGVGLEPDHAVDDLHAGFLQTVGEAEVGLLIEARAQLDHHGDVLAVAGRLDQRVHDQRVLAGAVQGLLDRQHVGVDGGLLDHIQHRGERIEGMVQQHVPARDDLEDPVAVAQGARAQGGVLQFRPLDHVVQLDHAVEVDRAVDTVDRVFGQPEVLQQGAHDVARAVLRDLQPDRRAVATVDQFIAQRQGEVLDLFLVHHQLGITGHAELVGPLDFHAREHLIDESRQHRGQEHEGLRAAELLRQLDDARQRARCTHDRQVPGAAKRVGALEHHHDVQRFVEDLRERVRGIQAERGQHRHDLVAEIRAQPAFLAVVPGVPAEYVDACLVQRRAQRFVPAAVLLVHQLCGAVVDRIEDRLRRHAIRRRRQAELLRMAHGGGADLEELVQVGAGDAHEAQALQQRHLRVHGLGQHAEIEIQLRQFTVDVQRRVAQRIAVHGYGDGNRSTHPEKSSAEGREATSVRARTWSASK